jgi:hypothetical protein
MPTNTGTGACAGLGKTSKSSSGGTPSGSMSSIVTSFSVALPCSAVAGAVSTRNSSGGGAGA